MESGYKTGTSHDENLALDMDLVLSPHSRIRNFDLNNRDTDEFQER